MASYKQLGVYQKAYDLVLEIYKVAKKLPKEEQYGLISQMQRAAVSIPLNIAEGYGKLCGKKEIGRFLSMARGSSCEMDVLLSLSKDLGYIDNEQYEHLAKAYEEVAKMVTGLMKSLTN